MQLELQDFDFLVKEGDIIELIQFDRFAGKYKVISIKGEKVELEKVDEKNT